jgi:hypothetical protein
MKQLHATIEDCRIWGRFSERFEAYGTVSELVDRSRWIGLDGHLWSMIKIEADDAKYLVRSYRTEAQYHEAIPTIDSAEKTFQVLVQFDASYAILGYFARRNLVSIFDYLEIVSSSEAKLMDTAIAAIAVENL